MNRNLVQQNTRTALVCAAVATVAFLAALLTIAAFVG